VETFLRQDAGEFCRQKNLIMKKMLLTIAALTAFTVISATAENNSTNTTATTDPAPTVSTNKIKLTVVKVDSEETSGEDGRGANAVDGDPETIWHTQWQDANPECPHEIIIKLSEPAAIMGFCYLPRQDESDHGQIKDYEFYVSDDGKDFGKPVKKGTFDAGKEKKTVKFDGKKCQFIKLRALSEINGEAWTSAAEIGVVLAD
jgi:hypothetical protein